MAQVFPELEVIKKQSYKATPGEIACVKYLSETFSNVNDIEIYIQPTINSDRPDIIIMRKGYGIMILEVKDWNLERYSKDKKGNWIVKSNGTRIKSPSEQVREYRNNLYKMHIPNLYEKSFKNNKYNSLIQTAVYFHNEKESNIQRLIGSKNKYPRIFNTDSMKDGSFQKYLKKTFSSKSTLFTNELFLEFRNYLQPPVHSPFYKEEINLTPKQKELAESRENTKQKIKGVVGSGKTIVLVKRAINSQIRTGKKTLILTFNISLRNYILFNLRQMNIEYDRRNIKVDSYHNFISSEANNHNIYFRKSYLSGYGNLDLFENVKSYIKKYDSILIDEVQDYSIEWLKMVEKYFLAPEGEFVLFGDEKQNIYGRELDDEKKIKTTIPGRWSELNESFRLSNNLALLANNYQQHFFRDKYSLDTIETDTQMSLYNGSIEHYDCSNDLEISDLAESIMNIVKEKGIKQNDLCIQSDNTEILRNLDYELRNNLKQKTTTTFETEEVFNKISNDNESQSWKIREIRKNKKFNFRMFDYKESIKLSTIHSFKGWEIPSLFLIIDNDKQNLELIYTAITRCRSNLFIMNLGNESFKDFCKENKNLVTLKSLDKKFHSEKIKTISEATDSQKKGTWRKNKQNRTKTIGDIKKKKSDLLLTYIMKKLKGTNKKFKICILGEIAQNKKIFEEELGTYFRKNNVNPLLWEVSFIDNRNIKNKNVLKQLKVGRSSFSLIITGQIQKHSSKGNSSSNLLQELEKPSYIKKITGCPPQKKLTIENTISKLDGYFTEIEDTL